MLWKKLRRGLGVTLSAVLVCGSPGTFLQAQTDKGGELAQTSFPKAEALTLAVAGSKSIFDLGVSRTTDFNAGWRFYRDSQGSSPAGAEGKNFDDTSWRQLDLPHDWSIELDFNKNSPDGGEAGFLEGGVGWYRKTFTLPPSMAGKKINLHFDGVYMNSTVYVNGELMGNYPNGYLPFSYDISNAVKTDGVTKNVIAVKAENKQPTSRWYSGSGIYRDVSLVVTDPVHVKEYGVVITTPNVEEEIATGAVNTEVKTTVQNQSGESASAVVTQTIFDSSQREIGKTVGEATVIPAGESAVVNQLVVAENPKLWDIESPNLYKMVTEVTVDGKLRDVTESQFGYRYFSASANDGFMLNGRYIKLNGVCMHHDQGALGSVQNYAAMDRQMEIMQEMGVNAIRVTHAPASAKFIEICEKRGLLVIDEAFDTWYGGKLSNDYHIYFEKQATAKDAAQGEIWAEYDLKKTVKRAINSPAIIMWSVGNEVGEANGTAKSITTIKNMVQWIKSVDDTRYVTMGDDKFRMGTGMGNHENIAEELDIVGGNYSEGNYDALHTKHPDWILYGSETSSATKSRGVYTHVDENMSQHRHESEYAEPYQQSSADNDHVGWGKTATDSWKPDRDRKYILGQFIWTGFDYIGEATPWHKTWPPKSSYFGIVDTAGFPKDDFFLYQSQWNDVNEKPMVHIFPHWNWEEEGLLEDLGSKDGKIPVRIYSNAAKVELFLNGVSQGEKAFVQKTTSDGRTYQEGPDLTDSLYAAPLYLEWRLDYAPGELKAVAKNADGEEIATDVVATSGAPAKLQLSADRTVIDADGYDLSYITVDVVDAKGNIVPYADNQINFKLSGNGKIVGVDNGNALSHERFKDTKRQAFHGKALVIVQSTKTAGPFTITASGSGVGSSSITGYSVEAGGNGEDILGYSAPLVVQTTKGTLPELPTQVNAIYSDGSTRPVTVAWDLESITNEQLETAGTFEVSGAISGGSSLTVTVLVTGDIGVMEYRTATMVGVLPELPEKVTVMNNDGSEEKAAVEWQPLTQEQVAEPGVVTLTGTVTGSSHQAKAIIRVTAEKAWGNVATEGTAHASFNDGPGDNHAGSINDGDPAQRPCWNNWVSPGNANAVDEWVTIEFDQVRTLNSTALIYYTDGATKLPAKVVVEASADGTEFIKVGEQTDNFQLGSKNVIPFEEPIDAKVVRYTLTAQPLDETNYSPVGLAEVYLDGELSKPNMGTDALLSEITVNGNPLEGFDPNVFNYQLDLRYGEEMPVVAAKSSNHASFFIVPAVVDGDSTVIKVVSEDGLVMHTYTLGPNRLPVGVNGALLAVGSATVQEDEQISTNLTVSLEDGKVLAPSEYTVVYESTSENGGAISILNGVPYALTAGSIKLKAIVTYGQDTMESNEVEITITPNEAKKIAMSYDEPMVEVKKGETPVLPQEVEATFDLGIPRNVPVTWEALPEEFKGQYGTYYLQGTVENQVLKPIAKIVVRDAIAVETFRTVTAPGQVPNMPKTATITYSDGTATAGNITWEAIPDGALSQVGSTVTVKGSVEGATLKTSMAIRVTDQVAKGKNIAKQWTGSEFPAGIAKYTNDGAESSDKVTAINNDVIEFTAESSDRWTDWKSTNPLEENWVGILFAEGGTVQKKYVNNLHVGFFDDGGVGAPASYTVEYFTPQSLEEIPLDSNERAHMGESDNPLAKEENWTAVANLNVVNGEIESIEETPSVEETVMGPEDGEIDEVLLDETTALGENARAAALPAGQMIEMNFDSVHTFAIRIRMNRQTTDNYKGLAIVEMQVFAEEAVANKTYEVTNLLLDGKALDGFAEDTREYTVALESGEVPNITLEATNEALGNVIPAVSPNGTAKISVVAEDGTSDARTYQIHFTYDAPRKNIVEVSKPQEFLTPVSVLQGATEEQVLASLPETVAVRLDTTESVTVPVLWNVKTYDSASLQTQVVEGQISLSAEQIALAAVKGVTYNPAGLSAFVKVKATPNTEYKTVTIKDTVGGNATVTVDHEEVLPGGEVKITISQLQEGKIFNRIEGKGADGTALLLREVQLGKEYAFNMPNQNVSITVYLADESKPTEYAITVTQPADNAGKITTDKAKATAGESVTVTISEIKEGVEFTGVTYTDALGVAQRATEIEKGKTYAFDMPESNVVVAGIVKAPIAKYPVNIAVTGGNATVVSSAAEAALGEVVKITISGIPSNKKFQSITIKDVDQNIVPVQPIVQGSQYQFAMTNKQVTVTVALTDVSTSSGGGSSSGGGGGTLPGTSNGTTNTKKDTTSGSDTEVAKSVIKAEAVTDAAGNATVSVSPKEIESAISSAISQNKDAKKLQVEIAVSGEKDAKEKTIQLDAASLTKLQAANAEQLRMVTEDVTLGFNQIAMEHLQNDAQKGIISIKTEKANVSNLSEAAKVAIGNRPVYHFTAYQEETAISSFGAGAVHAEIAYQLQVGEKEEGIHAVYVDNGGKTSLVPGSYYDAEKSVVVFTTDHFSTFGVAYEEPVTENKTQEVSVYADTQGHWAEQYIIAVTKKGIMNGLSAERFAPDAPITRGMFVTALGRYSQEEIGGYQAGTFADVSEGMYYTQYVEWAAAHGIVDGVQERKFAPDKEITREEMAVIIERYEQYIGQSLPSVQAEFDFTDADKINVWAQSAVRSMQQAGVLKGRPDGAFDPAGQVTRAECSTVFALLLELQ